MQRILGVGTVVLAALLAGGCGSSGGKVSGTVRDRNDKPVPSGTVTFYVVGAPPVAAEITDGRYEAVNVLLGEAVVTVVGPSADATPRASSRKPTPTERPIAIAVPPPPPPSVVPIQYSDSSTTPLRFTVEKGDNTFNVKLD